MQTAYVTMQRRRTAGRDPDRIGLRGDQHKYITIGTKILGQIMEEPIEEGQHVKKGDLLARIDDRDYRAQLHQAIADRDLAAANVKLKQTQAARMRTLYQKGVASRDQLDVAENALDSRRALNWRAPRPRSISPSSTSASAISPRRSTESCCKKYRELGDTINYGGDIQAGGGATDIVQLADTEDMRAEVDINEIDIAKVALGAPAKVIPDAYPDRAFDATGWSRFIPRPIARKGTVKVEVSINQARPRDYQARDERAGQLLSRRHPRGGKADAAGAEEGDLIPRATRPYVWTMRDGAAERVSIKRGRELEDGVEVKEGLNDGDLVIVEPPGGLKEGQKVIAKAG